MDLYPLKFKPVYKDYPWGNSKLPNRFGRVAPEGIYAESWEVSTHPDGESVIENGEFRGLCFSDVLKKHHAEILGSAVKCNDFPLLIKILDAETKVSVQVHPNDSNASEVGGEAKTEMWYFLNETPSEVYCGLVQGTLCSDFISAMEENHFRDVLRTIPVKNGEATYVPGGRVHAIGSGCLIYEIQQRSNTTYRVYDWGRVGNDGKPRELHIEKAMKVINFGDDQDPLCAPKMISTFEKNICTSPYFVLNELSILGAQKIELSGETFNVLFSADGAFEILYGNGKVESVARGTSVLIPANLGDYSIRSAEKISVLKTSVPV